LVHLATILVGMVLLLSRYIFIFRSIREHLELQQEIHAKLPPNGKFELLSWWMGTREKFRQLQKELLPDSPRPKRLRRFHLMSFALFLSGVALLAIGLRK
jgi:hypothetical protein